ncbi:hypothetical protein [Streptomyces sp. NPDC002644]
MSLGDDYGDGQTRTRLPEPSGVPPRRGRGGGGRSSRGMVTAVGVIVLLIAAIAFANRGGDADAPAAGKSSTAEPTAPTGERPVASGFARDEQGAQSAAANYAVALGSTAMFNTRDRHAVVDALYTPRVAAELKPEMDQAYSAEFLAQLGLNGEGNPPEGSTFVSRTVPVGTKVEAFGTTTAKVSVWYVGLIGMSGPDSTDPVTTTWKTWTFDLRWSDGDWEITDDSQKDGPAPVPGDDKASTTEEISKVVEEYGGFTYAR